MREDVGRRDGNAGRTARRGLTLAPIGLAAACLAVAGCGAKPKTPVVFFLDGAGHFGYAGNVEHGLRQGGYEGRFETFVWTSLLGPGVDHFVSARMGARAGKLARTIERIRDGGDQGPIHLIGLSAGSAVAVAALEQLDDGVAVDNVVLLSASISARHDLSEALRHLRGHLYVTASLRDGILAVLPVKADGGSGPPAGRTGAIPPRMLSGENRTQYGKVVNLPWRPEYAGYGWDGGHTRVTSPGFVAAVLCPRLSANERFPLDRPLYSEPNTNVASPRSNDIIRRRPDVRSPGGS